MTFRAFPRVGGMLKLQKLNLYQNKTFIRMLQGNPLGDELEKKKDEKIYLANGSHTLSSLFLSATDWQY